MMSLYRLARDNDVEALADVAKHSESVAVRRRAATVLGEVGDPEDDRTVDVLIYLALEDGDLRVRAAAVDALDDLGGGAVERLLARRAGVDPSAEDGTAVRAFAAALEMAVPEFRMAAANALGRIGAAGAVGPLAARLDDDDPRVRERACHALGRIGDPRPVEELRRLLADDRGAVKAAAADALGTIATGAALDALCVLLDDENASLRRLAASALGNAAGVEPISRLATALSDEHETVRRAAVFSISELLANAPTERSRAAREAVVSELAAVDDETVVGPLVEILAEADRPRQRRNAVWFLGRVTSDRPPEVAVDALVDALCDDDRITARIATTSVATLEGLRVESSLIAVLEDDDAPPRARANAAHALGDVGGSRARAALDRTADDDGVEDAVRKRAFTALSKLGGVR